MKRVMALWLATGMLLIAAGPALAHGGGKEPADAPTLVRQAIAFLEGTNNAEMATEKIDDALALNQQQQAVDKGKLEEAKQALANSRLDAAKGLMVAAIKGDPARDLALHPAFQGNTLNDLVLVLAVILVGWGLAVIRKNRTPQGGKS